MNRLPAQPNPGLVIGTPSLEFFETASLSKTTLDWLTCGGGDEMSGDRIDSLSDALLLAMQTEGWDPRMPQNRETIVAFDISLGGDTASFEVSVNSRGTDLLHIHCRRIKGGASIRLN